MLNHIREPERRYVTLDDGNARRLASTDPSLFFETYGYPLLIDEFQRVPSILLEMKKTVDQKALAGEENNGMLCLTGSQKFKMMRDVADFLIFSDHQIPRFFLALTVCRIAGMGSTSAGGQKRP